MTQTLPRRRARALLAAGGLLVLAGCSGTGSTPVTDAVPILSPAYAPTALWHATRDGLRTVIHGNPFAIQQAETERAVLSTLRMPSWHQRTQFVSYPSDGKRRGYRLVVIFNPADPISQSDVCGDLGEIPAGPSAAMTRLHVAFCVSERPLSYIGGSAEVGGPDDPTFRQLLAQVMDQLLPPRNFLIRDDGPSHRRWLNAYRRAAS